MVVLDSRSPGGLGRMNLHIWLTLRPFGCKNLKFSAPVKFVRTVEQMCDSYPLPLENFPSILSPGP